MKNKFQLAKKYQREIIVGVIVSLITAGIISAANWIKEIAPTAGHSIIRFFSNTFYSSLASQSNTSIILMVVVAASAFTIGLFCSVVVYGFQKTKEATELGESTLKELDDPQPALSVKEDIEQELRESANRMIKLGKRMKTHAIIGIILLVIVMAWFYIFHVAPSAMWATYEQDLVKISPYIDQQQMEEIRSNWVSMQCKEDYDLIYIQIDSIKQQHNLP